MRILFLPNFEVSRTSGDDPAIFPANKYLGKDQYWFFRHMPDVEVDVLDNHAPYPLDRLSRRLSFELLQPVKALMRQGSYDLVISHSYNSGLVFSFLRSMLSMRKPPHVVIDVGCLNGAKERPTEIRIMKFALRSVSGLVFHSSVNESFYSHHFSGTRRRFVAYGTDPEFFKPLDTPSTGDYALSIGIDKRDWGTLIEAWKKVDFPLKIVGNPDLDVSGSKNIQTLPKVSILRLKEMIHHSKLVVLPVEDIPYSVGQMTFTQCMAMGKPIVATAVPGLSDYEVDGINCLTFEKKNPEHLAEKVNVLLQNPKMCAQLSANARKHAVEHLSEERMAKEIHEFLLSTMNSSRPSPSRDTP